MTTYDGVVSQSPEESLKYSVRDEEEGKDDAIPAVKVLYHCGLHATYDLDDSATDHTTEESTCKGVETTTVLLVEADVAEASGIHHSLVHYYVWFLQ